MKILISACLAGQAVRYDGQANASKVRHIQQQLRQWRQQNRLVEVCPELAGGLPVPRPAAEIIAASGAAVLSGNGVIRTASGDDVTRPFVTGAQKTLQTALQQGAVAALLAARSPSCGADGIYDGSFSGQITPGQGVTAALLEQHGIRCFTPQQFDLLEQYLLAQDEG
ncbi:MAG: hypothetical protein CMI02_19390 [Oceanospirillaceae bacterium]|nr:hypothetical protein [Oceanospirillaceae bacterium]MBT14193.1 hypothetical protein [Oceanospirillaceae bacterium]|tara:strand:+ start:27101 stop:27604 length:504 start_codon:yes stop_codon:yes gene_type:complete